MQPRLPAVIVAGILAGIGIRIGLVLFIVPGLFLLTIWALLIPVIVIEGKSAGEAFSRSREIVRGHGWSVFGLVIVTFLLVGIASALIQLVFAWLPHFLEVWIGSLIAHSLTVPFAAAALTTAYFQLTASRTGTGDDGACDQRRLFGRSLVTIPSNHKCDSSRTGCRPLWDVFHHEHPCCEKRW